MPSPANVSAVNFMPWLLVHVVNWDDRGAQLVLVVGCILCMILREHHHTLTVGESLPPLVHL